MLVGRVNDDAVPVENNANISGFDHAARDNGGLSAGPQA
jgi:hypothetical protein